MVSIERGMIDGEKIVCVPPFGSLLLYSIVFLFYMSFVFCLLLLICYVQTFSQEADEAPDTTPGDLVFRVVTAPHKRFVRDRDNLHFSLTVSLLEVLLVLILFCSFLLLYIFIYFIYFIFYLFIFVNFNFSIGIGGIYQEDQTFGWPHSGSGED